MQYPIIYLHIPKTAGTSFRVSAEHYFGGDNTLNDYGPGSDSTSEDILSAMYDQADIQALRERGLKAKFFGGHFSLPKYREVFPQSPVVTFFRDPVDRVVSEFIHFTNHYDYKGTLEAFYNSARFQNRQHRSLGGARPTDLDFFGLTEQYDLSLSMFNQRYGTRLERAELNKGNYGTSTRLQPTTAQIDEIKHLNQADVALYQCALEHFEKQDCNTRLAISMATRYRGNFGGIEKNHLYGWIIDSQSSSPPVIRITVNGESRLKVVADAERPDLVRNGMHKDGKCGFTIPLNDLGQVCHQDSIAITTEDGSFELINSPLVVNG